MWENEAVTVDTHAADATVRLADGIGPGDLAVASSDCGQYRQLMYGQLRLALVGGAGGDVEVVEFADGRRYRVEELMAMLSI